MEICGTAVTRTARWRNTRIGADAAAAESGVCCELTPIVEIPLKYVGNRTSVVLDARRLYDFIAAFPPEAPVVFRSDAIFETRDGVRLFVCEE